MLDDLELFQGAVLRQIVVGASTPVYLAPLEKVGRISTFVINDTVGIHVKHSTKRMSPWTFTFHFDQLKELLEVETIYKRCFVVLVCGTDGLATLQMETLRNLVDFNSSEQAWIRVRRQPRSMYGISGNRGELPNKVARGVSLVHLEIQ